jgi:uncharacterized protein YbjT (DUF2867 family)
MKVFVAGATGALGTQLVPMLVPMAATRSGCPARTASVTTSVALAFSRWSPTRWMPTP